MDTPWVWLSATALFCHWESNQGLSTSNASCKALTEDQQVLTELKPDLTAETKIKVKIHFLSKRWEKQVENPFDRKTINIFPFYLSTLDKEAQ